MADTDANKIVALKFVMNWGVNEGHALAGGHSKQARLLIRENLNIWVKLYSGNEKIKRQVSN